MSRKNIENIETFVLMPYQTYKVLDQKSKNVEHLKVSDEAMEHRPVSPTVERESTKAESTPTKDLSHTYRSTHMKKLIKHLEDTNGSTDIIKLENLDALIKSALNQSRKKLPNEEEFFRFLLNHGLGHFVKNRSKIDLYMEGKDLWYKI